MIMLDMLPYDAILGYDWLKHYSPMTCDWQAKTFTFQHQGTTISLKGTPSPTPEVTAMSAKQVYKSSKGNDIWAFVVLASAHAAKAPTPNRTQFPEELQLLLAQYADVF